MRISLNNTISCGRYGLICDIPLSLMPLLQFRSKISGVSWSLPWALLGGPPFFIYPYFFVPNTISYSFSVIVLCLPCEQFSTGYFPVVS